MPLAAALPWWAATLVARSVAGVLLAGAVAWRIPSLVFAGAALLPFGATLAWSGMRVFHHRAAPWWMLVVVGAAWITIVQAPVFAGEPLPPLPAGMAFSATLLLACCYELWRGRAERLMARWPMFWLTGIHAAFFMVTAAAMSLTNLLLPNPAPLWSWFNLSQLVFVVLLLGVAVLGVMLCRERLETMRLAEASKDALTGVANRGSFLGVAERMFERAAKDGSPVSLILFDLDDFKCINDTQGHAAGDAVLQAFVRTAIRSLRPGDAMGRIGGEEFCVALVAADSNAAYVIAERIRTAFRTDPVTVGGVAVAATVSAGVATTCQTSTVETVLSAADRALYAAKRLGKNRVEVDDSPQSQLSGRALAANLT
jgi:diguanylate cyclase (GGDEF)-like protein